MPVRSLRSSVLKWPDRRSVEKALARWARQVEQAQPAVRGIGCFGSYARGDWGVGSDLDLLIILTDSDQPRERRALAFDKERLPVPADLLVFTLEEWRALRGSGSRFSRVVARELIWLKEPPPQPRGSSGRA
jgi:uncharacterized protein